jgi:hypothetical protein
MISSGSGNASSSDLRGFFAVGKISLKRYEILEVGVVQRVGLVEVAVRGPVCGARRFGAPEYISIIGSPMTEALPRPPDNVGAPVISTWRPPSLGVVKWTPDMGPAVKV